MMQQPGDFEPQRLSCRQAVAHRHDRGLLAVVHVLDDLADPSDRVAFEEPSGGNQTLAKDDVRIVRALRGAAYDEDAVRNLCYDRLEDEFIGLKESFGDRAMTKDEALQLQLKHCEHHLSFLVPHSS